MVWLASDSPVVSVAVHVPVVGCTTVPRPRARLSRSCWQGYQDKISRKKLATPVHESTMLGANDCAPPSGAFMDTVRPPAPCALDPPAPRAATPALPPSWTPAAHVTLGLLLGVALTLITLHFLGSLRSGTQPSQRESANLYLDLNSAGRDELLQLPGVGEKLAERILDHQQQQGFRRIEDLRKVSGIGPALLEKLRPFVYVEAEPTYRSAGEMSANSSRTEKPANSGSSRM